MTIHPLRNPPQPAPEPKPAGLRTYVLVAWAILATLLAQQQKGTLVSLAAERDEALILVRAALNEAHIAQELAAACHGDIRPTQPRPTQILSRGPGATVRHQEPQ